MEAPTGSLIVDRRPASAVAPAAIATVLLSWACSPTIPTESGGAVWVGSITTEGGVTTVVNESGSVWGGTATLVEEASVGVESGDEPYLLGTVAGVGVAGDRIYVLDSQVLRVRVYDLDGVHMFDFGGEGNGPGEFRRPDSLAVGPERLFVRDPQVGRITVFSLDGALLETWPHPPAFFSSPIVATASGELLAPHRGGMVPWGEEGPSGEGISFTGFESSPPRMTARLAEDIPGFSRGLMFARTVPFWPVPTWAMSPTGAMIRGEADAYEFTITGADGRQMRIESWLVQVPVDPDEAAWHRSDVVDYLRRADSTWEWDAPEIPVTKPAYREFVPAVTGQLWVLRQGAGYETSECDPHFSMWDAPERCWKDDRIVEGFDADGRFLGAIDVPSAMRFEPRPAILDDMVVAVAVDDAGTIMVKRYRLVPPSEG